MLDEAKLKPIEVPDSVEGLQTLITRAFPSRAVTVWMVDNRDLSDAGSIGAADVQFSMWPEKRYVWMDPEEPDAPVLTLRFVSGRYARVKPSAIYRVVDDSSLMVVETDRGLRYLLAEPDPLSLRLIREYRGEA